MVEGAQTRYARAGDVHLAYQVLSDGPLDLLLIKGLIPIDMLDEEPSVARFHRRLASFSRLVRFNSRGMGLSDPGSTSPTLEEHVQDALTVMDAVGITHCAVFSSGWLAAEAVMLAAAWPERVSHLVLVNATPRVMSAPGYPGLSREWMDAYNAVVFEPDAVARGVDILAIGNPSVARDAAYRAWWDRAGNRGASPAMARAITELHMEADVRGILGSIQVPTLVLHRRDICVDATFPVAHGRYLADHIPGAKYVELDGVDQSYWLGDTDLMLDEIEEFLTGARRGAEPDRALAAVLISDIVASTERITAAGERGWRDLLDRHDGAVRRQLDRFSGREIKATGDGVVATFDSPRRAVQCACAIRDAAAQLDLAVRVGVHFGEIELRDADIAGMTVHISARINALADSGEVLVSRTVTDLIAGSSITFTDRGEHELKGVPGTWQLFRVTDT